MRPSTCGADRQPGFDFLVVVAIPTEHPQHTPKSQQADDYQFIQRAYSA
jgi:hypothetical protein